MSTLHFRLQRFFADWFMILSAGGNLIKSKRDTVRSSMKLLIRNLARTTTEAEIRAKFEAFGTVQSCNLVKDKKSGLSKGFAFVQIPKAGAAKAAMKSLNGTMLDGNVIRVKQAQGKADTTPDSGEETAN
jgi:RNA recognition motif-containing protein